LIQRVQNFEFASAPCNNNKNNTALRILR
jgi:hypothetical protein